MTTKDLRLAASLLAAIPMLLTAQVSREHDPVRLKHWPAPLYWQGNRADAAERLVAIAEAAATLPPGANALVFVGMTPCRVVDTRVGQAFPGAFGPPSIAAGTSRTFPIQSSSNCAIPSVAQAYSLNITVIPPGPLGFITAYPTGQPLPLAATLNSLQGYIVANAAVVTAGTNGSMDIYASDQTEVVVDINGYYASLGGVQLGSLPGSNTALGLGALANLTTGGANTASGFGALASNTTGNNNTATGFTALNSNTTGTFNTATGENAMQRNTTGSSNVANGDNALRNNTIGESNTATGTGALRANISGSTNTANGASSLGSNTTGGNNTASGNGALGFNTTGNNNIAIGFGAALAVSGGSSNNIHIGSQGATNDSGAIRIGKPGTQYSFFAAGIRGVTTGSNDAIPVVIDSSGQIGTFNSSRRFKEDIRDMGAASGDLLRLRPVTFRYKEPFVNGTKPIQYGLIAEEVAEVYPDLVARSADGQIETVKYQVLDSMLLNELQKEQQQLQQQAEMIRLLQTRLVALETLIYSKVSLSAVTNQGAPLVPGMIRGGSGEEQSLHPEGQAGARQPKRPSALPQN